MSLTFEYKGVTYAHTDKPWRSHTNRHTTTQGYSWGWISGPVREGGDICWSNDPGDRFTERDAAEVISFHNEWLKEQEPVSLRLVRASERLASAEKECNLAEIRYLESQEALAKASAEVERLEAMLRAGQVVIA